MSFSVILLLVRPQNTYFHLNKSLKFVSSFVVKIDYNYIKCHVGNSDVFNLLIGLNLYKGK